MHFTKGTFLVLTLCLSCSGIWAKPSLDLFKDLLSGIGDATHGVIDGIKDGAELTKDILEGLHDKKHAILEGVGEDLTKNLDQLASTLQGKLKVLEGLVSTEINPLKKKALQSGLEALKGLGSTVAQLKGALVDIGANIGGKIEGQITDILEDLHQWGEDQLERVRNSTNGAGVGEAKERIESLIEDFTDELLSHVAEFGNLLSKIEQDVSGSVEQFTGFAKDLIETMIRCKLQSTSRCQESIGGLVDKLLEAKEELNTLLQFGRDLAVNGLNASLDIKERLAQLVADKLKCEKELDDIIEENADSEKECVCR